ncbi:uncharacterized protein LACBIDRAFT_305591 [Laccaria bicolor S238N-H82]|uniref:Predicted protein n=1 Tax=Laccaria bicolor (strain S238N-H82 / ATCC MYA-4686) TaxID=486041 RepID=B0CUM2_LACBS|nr:uncharacterized protein LACBIDRAFT_305591 [Laccaria bicolor S238N-H82]EDR14697.1 predicted protein [Laccaria bicolor S238N-H82]|eukprot:XP_001875256.1 predicted protein [Laccaria bicolor S238N-H82]
MTHIRFPIALMGNECASFQGTRIYQRGRGPEVNNVVNAIKSTASTSSLNGVNVLSQQRQRPHSTASIVLNAFKSMRRQRPQRSRRRQCNVINTINATSSTPSMQHRRRRQCNVVNQQSTSSMSPSTSSLTTGLASLTPGRSNAMHTQTRPAASSFCHILSNYSMTNKAKVMHTKVECQIGTFMQDTQHAKWNAYAGSADENTSSQRWK